MDFCIVLFVSTIKPKPPDLDSLGFFSGQEHSVLTGADPVQMLVSASHEDWCYLSKAEFKNSYL